MSIPLDLARYVVVAACVGLAASAGASYGVTPEMPVPNADAEVAAQALDAGDWQRAADNFQAALRAEPDNATFHAALGYAYRKLGDLPRSLQHLRRALAIDATLRAAHASIGETYLALRDPTRARAHLAALERLCGGRTCAEFVELERAIAAAR